LFYFDCKDTSNPLNNKVKIYFSLVVCKADGSRVMGWWSNC